MESTITLKEERPISISRLIKELHETGESFENLSVGNLTITKLDWFKILDAAAKIYPYEGD